MALSAIALAASLAANGCGLELGQLPANEGNVAEATLRYGDLPAQTRQRLRERMDKLRFDEVVEISRAGIEGRQSYRPELGGLQYGKQYCESLSRSDWGRDIKYTALSYCEGTHCLLVTVEGRHVLRAERVLSEADLEEFLRQQPTAAGAEPQFAPGRLLAGVRAGLKDAQVEAQARGLGAAKARRIAKSNLFVIDLPQVGNERAMLAVLGNNPHFRFVELDYRVPASLTPNDPYLGSQWHLSTVNAPTAWDSAQGAGVTVAVLDSGVNGSHPDLAARMVPGWNVIDGNNNTADVNGHGTMVAGVLAASLNNAAGVAGTAGAARLMPIRISDANAYAYWSHVASGLYWAADNGAKVANISYGAASSSSVMSAADYMRSKGGVVFVSAGNAGTEVTTATSTSITVVSATNSADVITSWSNWGSLVSLAAPGEGIWTTERAGGYTAPSGTSFAAPLAAGVAALVMSARPDLSVAQVQNALYSSARDLGAAGRDKQYGFGRVDAAAAVQTAKAMAVADTQAPVVSITSPGNGSSVSGLVSVSASATDNVGVTKAELLVNGVVVATETTSPFAFTWDTASRANGNTTLVVRGSDAAGNTGTSASLTVSVANAVAADTVAPVVSLLNPANGAVVSGTVSISVSASDNAGAAGLKQSLFINGALVASGTGGSLSYSWNTRKAAAGSYSIRAVATDAAGNSTAATASVSKR